MPTTREISADAMPLFARIKADHPQIAVFAYYLEFLALHMPATMLVPGLEWLLKNKLTGERFLHFVQGDCQRSGLELIRQLTMRLEHEKKLRRLYAQDVR